jgi:hypothetical protein
MRRRREAKVFDSGRKLVRHLPIHFALEAGDVASAMLERSSQRLRSRPRASIKFAFTRQVLAG